MKFDKLTYSLGKIIWMLWGFFNLSYTYCQIVSPASSFQRKNWLCLWIWFLSQKFGSKLYYHVDTHKSTSQINVDTHKKYFSNKQTNKQWQGSLCGTYTSVKVWIKIDDLMWPAKSISDVRPVSLWVPNSVPDGCFCLADEFYKYSTGPGSINGFINSSYQRKRIRIHTMPILHKSIGFIRHFIFPSLQLLQYLPSIKLHFYFFLTFF